MFPSLTRVATPPQPIEEAAAVPLIATLMNLGMSSRFGMFSGLTAENIASLSMNTAQGNAMSIQEHVRDKQKLQLKLVRFHSG